MPSVFESFSALTFMRSLIDEVASISSPGPCTVVPMRSRSSYYTEPTPTLRPLPTEATRLHPELLDTPRPHPYATPPSQFTVSQAFSEVTELLVSPTVSSPFYDVYTQEECSPTPAAEPSYSMGAHNRWSCPYPTPSLQPIPQLSSNVIASNFQGIPTHAGHSPISLSLEHPLPESTLACISPDVVCPPAYCGSNHKDNCSTDVSPQSSSTSRRAACHSSPSAPYLTPSPEPSPRTSSTVFSSRRRNAPARTAAPVSSNTWQCPYCPHVQHNRRSPDLKRHIKTHTRGVEVADWVCCGVPVMNAMELGVSAVVVQEAQVFDFDGVLMIGGCRKAFSRRDALKRHLQRGKGRCFGDALSLHQRGNREGC